MRELKFRAWGENIKEYMSQSFDGEVEIANITRILGDLIDQGNWVIEQYTGLKDKNGKEIYEGDIVKCYSQDTYPAGRVMYSEEWCAYEIVSYDPEDCRVYNLESFSPTVNEYLEVIGNIHENPELLGGEE